MPILTTYCHPYTESGVAKAAARTGVYAIFDDDGDCLYVGSSANVRERLQDHLSGTDESDCFNDDATRFCSEYYDRISDAEEREKALIREYRPPCNTQHNPSRSAYR